MEESQAASIPDAEPTPESAGDLPPGNHPLEVAARRGFGPLSSHASEHWHGHARPCVSCGQLVLRSVNACEYCGQDLGPDMLEKMRAHAGPWYVLEHVRPFPGVSLERIARQIRRGLITETSIVRGPATHHQWRFAVETPGICRYFGRCWQCQGSVSATDTTCPHCLSHQSYEKSRAVPSIPAPAVGATADAGLDGTPLTTGTSDTGGPGAHRPAPTPEMRPTMIGSDTHLQQLSAALHQSELPTHEPVWDDPPRVAGIRATWVAAGLLVAVVVTLMWIAQVRSSNRSPAPAESTGSVEAPVSP